ncbi:YchF/TatD family DNA exonuclease [Candidatus Profftia tarda]|nr:YchF/TatD family DNA exonuclease [Candidatus Profftia tarda]
MYLVDSHCHLNELNDKNIPTSIDNILEDAKDQSVGFVMTVATTIPGYLEMRQQIGERNNVAFSCGVHPLNVSNSYNYEELHQYSSSPEVIAIGETGLDFCHNKDNITLQKDSFIRHISVGKALDKPVIIHMRDACKDTLEILVAEKIYECGGILHCFTGDLETARKLLDMGCYISFSGIITFRNADELQVVARYVPADRILLETDSPYLAPVPHRGKQNRPAYLRDIALHLSLLRDVPIEVLAKQTTDNFSNLFGLNLPND